MYKIRNYLGIDVSETILNTVREKFKNDSQKKFLHSNLYQHEKAELAISFDVIFHLIEDDVFNDYMCRLFDASSAFVIIYSSNRNSSYFYGTHVRHRKFTDWVEKNRKNFRLASFIKNRYPENINDPNNTSFSDFYIYTCLDNYKENKLHQIKYAIKSLLTKPKLLIKNLRSTSCKLVPAIL